MNDLIKFSNACEIIKKDWPGFPKSAAYLAIGRGDIPHSRSSKGERAHIFVKVSDILNYFETLKQ